MSFYRRGIFLYKENSYAILLITLNKICVLILLVLSLLVFIACNSNIAQQSAEVSSTLEANKSDTQSVSPIPNSPIPASTAIQLTPIPTSSLENPILVSYEYDANDSIDYFTACLIGLNTFSFILYEDGHVILFDESRFMETTIPQAEIEKLLADIESTGFFLVKGDGDEFVSPPPAQSFVGTSMQIITVREKTFAITAGEYQYLIEPIKETIRIAKEYKPSRLEPYIPDKLNIWVYPVQDTALINYDPTPTPPTLEWSYESIPLDTLVFTLNSPSKTISGETLQFLIQEITTVPVYRMVKQNGQHYLVMACPVFQ